MVRTVLCFRPLLLAFFSFHLFLSTCSAQAIQWRALGGPYGGYIASVRVAGAYALAATPIGVYRSSDRGLSWTLSMSYRNVRYLTLDSSGMAFFYGEYTLFRSSNFGATWEMVRSFPNAIGSVIHVPESLVVVVTHYGSMYISPNLGAAWTINSSAPRLYIRGALDRDRMGRIFLGVDAGLYISLDSARTWSAVSTMNSPIHSLHISLQGDIFALVQDTLQRFYRSTDLGGSWNQIYHPGSIQAFTTDRWNTIHLATSQGIFRSTNGGLSWNLVDSLGILYTSLVAHDSLLLGGSAGQGVYRSDDVGFHYRPSAKGISNTSPSCMLVHPDGRIFVGTGLPYSSNPSAGIQFSTDGGQTWNMTSIRTENIVSIVSHPTGVLFAGQYGGVIRSRILKSTDGGYTWHVSYATQAPPRSFAVDSRGTVYAGTEGAGLMRSTDVGRRWYGVSSGFTEPNVYILLATPSDLLFAGVIPGVFRTTNLGASWTLHTLHPQANFVTALAASPNGTLFAGTGGITGYAGVYSSSNYGSTWSHRYFADHGISSLVVARNGDVYACAIGGPSSGVYRSTDNGSTWNWASQGLPASNGVLLALDSSGYLYAGVPDYGLYKTADPVTSVGHQQETVPQHYALRQNYPNPFNASTIIPFDLPEESHVSLVIYDVLGRKVADVVNEVQAAGFKSVTWDASAVASGVYFARFTAMDANGNAKFARVSKLLLAK